MNKILFSFFFLAFLSCTYNKNLAQSKANSAKDSLIQYINKSISDTEVINPKLKQLQQENDLVISFASLNYAWIRKASLYVLAEKNKVWKLYRYDTRLPPSAEDEAMHISSSEISAAEAEKIKVMYTKAKLWQTEGDKGGNSCTGKNDCNITDAESWAISVATKTNVHTTGYYAPEFFEECCPGNPYRKQFAAIAKAIMKLTENTGAGVDR